MKKMRLAWSILIVFFAASLQNQSIAQPFEIKIWDKEVPGSVQNHNYTESSTNKGGWYRISKVSIPTLKVYLPETGSNEKVPAILICPGGGYSRLAMDHEGYEVAEWLNSIGIAGMVLKYRLPSEEIMQDKSTGPLQDAQKAMRLIRNMAEKWNIDTTKIGVIGFSAGGHLASTLLTQYNKNVYTPIIGKTARPDFGILVYPVISMVDSLTHKGSKINLIGGLPTDELIREYSNELNVNSSTPPCFLIHSSDDKGVNYLNSMRFYEALIRNGVPSELHIYDQGGHGFGLSMRKSGPFWTPALETWLKLILDRTDD